jgi:hypothetical protein
VVGVWPLGLSPYFGTDQLTLSDLLRPSLSKLGDMGTERGLDLLVKISSRTFGPLSSAIAITEVAALPRSKPSYLNKPC